MNVVEPTGNAGTQEKKCVYLLQRKILENNNTGCVFMTPETKVLTC